MAHPNARLSVFGRQLLISRVTRGWSPAEAARQLGVSRPPPTSGCAATGPRATPASSIAPAARTARHAAWRTRRWPPILRARARRRYGPQRLAPLTGHPASTIYAVLRRAGVHRLRDADRLTVAPVRYTACHPGLMLHIDHKKLGRVPPGGGHRVLGRERAPHHGHANAGYEHLEVFVDDASRLAVVVPVADERGRSAARALEQAAASFAAAGIRIERVLTDNEASYRSHPFAAAVAGLGARHSRTRPFRPQTNGKAERFIQTLLQVPGPGVTERPPHVGFLSSR